MSRKTPVFREVWMEKGGGRRGRPKRPSRLWTVKGTDGREKREAANGKDQRYDPPRDLAMLSAVPSQSHTVPGRSGVFMEISEEVKAFVG